MSIVPFLNGFQVHQTPSRTIPGCPGYPEVLPKPLLPRRESRKYLQPHAEPYWTETERAGDSKEQHHWQPLLQGTWSFFTSFPSLGLTVFSLGYVSGFSLAQECAFEMNLLIDPTHYALIHVVGWSRHRTGFVSQGWTWRCVSTIQCTVQ